METEIWKDIPGYEWYYMVSNLGIVKSLDRPIRNRHWSITMAVWNIIYWFINNKWYRIVQLYRDWKKVRKQVHRLVASAFLWLDLDSFTNPKTSLCVCHKDDNPSNNRADNLFLGTHQDNVNDMIKKWRLRAPSWKDHYMYWADPTINPMYWRRWKLNPSSKIVIQMGKENNFIEEWESVTIAAEKTGIAGSNISWCCNWVTRTAWGYIWKYKY